MRPPFGVCSSTSTNHLYPDPLLRPLSFIQGDEFSDGPFLLPGRVMTPERPEGADGNPMYHSSEEVPVGVTASTDTLVAAWERRYWFADIRSSFLSTVRYHNGWVPWYGTRPGRVWWAQMSLGAYFGINVSYSISDAATKVVPVLESGQSMKLNPGASLRWSLESARPSEFDSDGYPVLFDGIKTWVRGPVFVTADWTLSTPVKVISPNVGQFY